MDNFITSCLIKEVLVDADSLVYLELDPNLTIIILVLYD